MISCSFYPHYFSQLLSKITFLIIILSNFFPVYFFSLFLTKWLFLISIYDFFTSFWSLISPSRWSPNFSKQFFEHNVSSIVHHHTFYPRISPLYHFKFLSISTKSSYLVHTVAPSWPNSRHCENIRWKKFPTLKCWDYAHFFQTIEQIDFSTKLTSWMN